MKIIVLVDGEPRTLEVGSLREAASVIEEQAEAIAALQRVIAYQHEVLNTVAARCGCIRYTPPSTKLTN